MAKNYMGNWDYNTYKWRYGSLFITGFWAHLVGVFQKETVFLLILDGAHVQNQTYDF